MSQLSFEQQVRGIVIRARFSNPEINTLVHDVTRLDVDAVVRCAEGLKCDETTTPHDMEKADIVLGSIDRLKKIDQQREPEERDVRRGAFIEQVSNPFDRTDLQ